MSAKYEQTQSIIQEGLSYAGPHIISTSCWIQASVMLHLFQELIQNKVVDLVFVDMTLYHPETYAYKKTLEDRLQIQAQVFEPHFWVADPESLYQEDESKFLGTYKHEPTKRMVRELQPQVWFSWRRKGQTEHRNHLQDVDRSGDITRVHPILHWTDYEIIDYMVDNHLPFHPLALSQFATRVGHIFQDIHRQEECGMHYEI